VGTRFLEHLVAQSEYVTVEAEVPSSFRYQISSVIGESLTEK
jgi:hypothetical protein